MRCSMVVLAVLISCAAASAEERPELSEHKAAVEDFAGASRRSVDQERRRADRNAAELDGYLTRLIGEGRDPGTDPDALWALDALAQEHAFARLSRSALGRGAPRSASQPPSLSRSRPGQSTSSRRSALRGDVAKLTAYVVRAEAYGVDASKERAELQSRRGELIRLHGLRAPSGLLADRGPAPTELRDALTPGPSLNPVGLPAVQYKPKPPQSEPGAVPSPERRGPVPTVEPSLFKAAKEAMFGVQRVGPGASKWSPIVDKYARRYNVPPKLVLAVIDAESNGNPKARSKAGAVGLMQLMPATARGLGFSSSKLTDPDTNIHAGVKYLSQLLKHYRGDVRKAVAAYNAGQGAVDRYGGVPPYKETRNYVKKVMGNYG